jgi:hypothetical protein
MGRRPIGAFEPMEDVAAKVMPGCKGRIIKSSAEWGYPEPLHHARGHHVGRNREMKRSHHGRFWRRRPATFRDWLRRRRRRLLDWPDRSSAGPSTPVNSRSSNRLATFHESDFRARVGAELKQAIRWSLKLHRPARGWIGCSGRSLRCRPSTRRLGELPSPFQGHGASIAARPSSNTVQK